MTDWKKDFTAVPFNRHLGLEIVDCGSDTAELRLPVASWFAQENGVIHGGILSAMADTTAVYAILDDPPEEGFMTSIELKVNFLAAGSVEGEALVGKANVVRCGSRVAVCESRVMQGDRLVLTGLFTYLIGR